METFSASPVLCEGKPTVTDGFPIKMSGLCRASMFYVLLVWIMLNKQPYCLWFETSWHSCEYKRCTCFLFVDYIISPLWYVILYQYPLALYHWHRDNHRGWGILLKQTFLLCVVAIGPIWKFLWVSKNVSYSWHLCPFSDMIYRKIFNIRRTKSPT